MPLNPTSKFLVDAIEALPLLDGRFEAMRLINYDSASDSKRGCFSLVFEAKDSKDGCKVAIKFFDPHVAMDVYRLNAFRREHEILESISGEARCLQLVSGLKQFDLPVKTATGPTISMKCEYFVVAWIEDEIDRYFLLQDAVSVVDRLKLFNSITLAVEALHARQIFHRDLKPDNLRLAHTAGAKIVIAIDLGTAAKYMSPPVQAGYSNSVGAPAYSSPEALCGLAGNRILAQYTDIYALGCMLFELFSPDLHLKAVFDKNPSYQLLLGAIVSSVPHGVGDASQKNEWDKLLNRLANAYSPVKLDGAGCNAPPGIAPILNEVLCKMAHIDYRCRPTLTWARNRISSAIRVMENERQYRLRLERVRELRRRKIASVHARIARHNAAKTCMIKGPAKC